MKKRFFSLLLALCIAITLMPLSVALAVNEDQGGDANNATMTPTVMPGSVTTTIPMAEGGQKERDEELAANTAAATDFAYASLTRLLSISELKEEYPNGSKWTGSFDGSIQCAGFARLLCYEAYGSEYH